MSRLQQIRSFVARTVRRTRDRALHPIRARRVRERLAGYQARSVIVLCHGNVCRSPFLQASLARHLSARGLGDIEIRSAGFIGPGRGSPETAIAVAAEMGFDLRPHRSAVVSASDLSTSDMVVVMSGDQAYEVRWRGTPANVPVVVLGDLDPKPIDSRTIVDPWNCDASIFRSSYERIDRCAKELAEILSSNRL